MLGQEVSGVSYIAIDINPHALRVTLETLDAHGVDADLMCVDNIASGLEKRLSGMVDVMVVNPPYVLPTPNDEADNEGMASAWAGGKIGRSVIDRILPVLIDFCQIRDGYTWLPLQQ
jgi:release factor glutamine methyltransferase